MTAQNPSSKPHLVRMHSNDNVAILGNDSGLAAGTTTPDGPTLKDKIPQAHKVALTDPATGQPLSVAAVLLTGGQGSRLGGCAKSLVQVNGKPLVLRQLEALHAAGIQQIVVVTGFYHAEVETLLRASAANAAWAQAVRIVRNPAPENGQQSSVLHGLSALAAPFDLALVVLVDQPLMTAHDYQECIEAYAGRPLGTSIAYPRVDGKRGNPVALGHEAVRAVLALGETCRAYIEGHRELVHQYPSQNGHFLADIDTLSDIKNLREQAGLNLQLP